MKKERKLKLTFIARYYSLVTDDIFNIKIEAESIEEAISKANDHRKKLEHVEWDYDLFVDTLLMKSMIMTDPLTNKDVSYDYEKAYENIYHDESEDEEDIGPDPECEEADYEALVEASFGNHD